DGTAPSRAVKTLSAALALCTAGNNDVVVIIGDGASDATIRMSATLDWNKNATHLVGITAPTWEAQRARIAPPTTQTTNINPLLTVSASGCYFANFSFFQGVGQASTDEQLINITGMRNYFERIHFGGMGHANGAARAGSYIMKFTNGDENTFESCAIGLETIQRSAANGSIVIASGSQRNRFINCEFPMAASATSPLWLDASAAGALNGSTMIFRSCLFRNLLNISSAQTPAVVCTVNGSVNGTIIFDKCSMMATKWVAATAQVQVINAYLETSSAGYQGGKSVAGADS
ncbi:MAG: hypothetical protein ACHQ6U_13490, partial [Thermodesulfobacteriota bacterium]